MLRFLAMGALLCAPLRAQTCSSIPTYTPCDFVFEAEAAEVATHTNPYLTASLHAEFRSPRHRTILINGFWDGGRRFVIRFTPTDAGAWDFRVTSNLASLNGKIVSFTAPDSQAPGFLKPENVHAWAYSETRTAHLWMGDTSYRFPWIERTLFDQMVEARAQQKFNHIRGLIMHPEEKYRKAYIAADQPNIEHFQELDSRILAMNRRGIFADLVLGGDQNHLAEVFPARQQRERFIKYVASRYSPMMITWQGIQEFEEYVDGRTLLAEIGEYLEKYDPFKHPRSTHTTATSAPLLADRWMTHATYQTCSTALTAVERQILSVPLVNAEFAYEDSGAGKSHEHHTDSETFRKTLWNQTMNGVYPTFGNTGTYGGRKFEVEAKYLETPGTKAMTAWYDFFAKTRFWELQPYFEADGGRAMALEGIEYIVYLEKPGIVELVTEKKGYEVYWYRPATGEVIREKKDYKGERFTGQPPDTKSDWVLHLSRDGRKEGMLKSWKFESRRVYKQDVEQTPAKIPFVIEAPSEETIQAGKRVKFAAKLTRETRASKAMMYVWTAEITVDHQGYRVIGTGQGGDFVVPVALSKSYPAVLNLRLYGINGVGKVYALDRVMRIDR
jgi:hypothetical protein